MFRKLTAAVVVTCLVLSAVAVQAGAVGGPRRHVDVVAAYSIDTYHIAFRAGELAFVVVSGDGDTDLDLYVYDANGNLIASDSDPSDDCVVGFTPRWTGSFTIRIVNRGPFANRYVLATN
jgi:hypothetical protein